MSFFVKSEKGKNKLVHDNHVYVHSKITSDGEQSIWVCEKRGQCKGRVWTLGETTTVTKVVMGHTHAAQTSQSKE